MSTLIVTAHPDPASLTLAVAHRLQAALAADAGPVTVADLAAEGFDPRYTAADRQTYRTGTDPAPDVAAEQARLDGAEHLVLVFPVWWWSLPALLKGWLDRVFVNGWAFGVGEDGRIDRRLGRLTVHLVPIAGDDAGVYERHGYEHALRTQLEHGVVDFCGAVRGATAFVHESEHEDPAVRERAVAAAVERVVAAVRG
ncbi:NAD(P)H-dependent oxidoreductase [Curtobacterium sp. TXMA1]|uniref:NAD(P)H-dependent oxidoreductase n=1 Tax=Curtobacterium sp. TXMA1 TaxID=2876939 RepID=UPI001CD036CC|nr:NAD(P)H-dependent oxidoreductase [Curtobacterium sp. TXMA1]UBQ01279.1 NAD(P)H-dependent oxidoreductase [Curtobacterium sp. TXMA1]